MYKAHFPHLIDHNFKVTSPCTSRYNCFAWAAGDDTRRWDPSRFWFWPAGVPRERTVSALIQVFETLGYAECEDGREESGYEKVALYAKHEKGELVTTHAAKQILGGGWSSKLGDLEDIVHIRLEDLNGPAYGEPVQFMRRPKQEA